MRRLTRFSNTRKKFGMIDNQTQRPSIDQTNTPMIILSWNVRGLNARIKKSTLRKLINTHKLNFVFIQETKMESLNPKFLKSLWNENGITTSLSPSIGNSGGLITLRQEDYFAVESMRIKRNWIALCRSILSLNFKVCIINVYNPCDPDERVVIWSQLTKYWSLINLPSLFLRDFNEVLQPNERGSHIVSQKGIDDFQSFIENTQLTEIPPSNGWFTWFQGASKSKLDRLLINPEWISTLPYLQVSILKRSLSDHCPLLVKSVDKNWGPKPFRSQNCWLSHP